MLVRKTNPVGIDLVIDKLQVFLYQLAISTNNTWECYPRAYKNPKRFDERGFIPEVFNDSNNDYKEVFFDDYFDVSTFFVVGDNREISNGKAIAPLALIIQCKPNDLFPSVSHRADEEVINLFWNKLKSFSLGAKCESIETSINAVYREFSINEVKFDDMNNSFVARINMTATFESQCCNDC